jgi:hypothetical protein
MVCKLKLASKLKTFYCLKCEPGQTKSNSYDKTLERDPQDQELLRNGKLN